MKTFRYIFGLMALLVLMLSNPALSYSAPQDSVRRVLPSSLPQGEQVIFFEDFNPQNGKIDSSKWSLCPKRPPHWARFLSESYDEAYIHDGALRLVAHKSKEGYKVGGIHTKGKFYFRYGRVEVCALQSSSTRSMARYLDDARISSLPQCHMAYFGRNRHYGAAQSRYIYLSNHS